MNVHILGVLSDYLGSFSPTSNRNTVKATSTYIENETFSPLSGGTKNSRIDSELIRVDRR